jgi:hypothetical protein
LEIVGAKVFEVAHEGGIITDNLGIEGFQALIVKHPLRHLAAGDQLISGAGDDDYNSDAPIFGVGGHLILPETHPLRRTVIAPLSHISTVAQRGLLARILDDVVNDRDFARLARWPRAGVQKGQ